MLSQIPEEHIKLEVIVPGGSESVYSSSSSKCSASKRKTLAQRQRVAVVSEIRQRVLSARMHNRKSLQNQLAVAQQQMFDLQQENKSLRTTVRRQEKALIKYDSANSELPQLLNSHSEEVRSMQAKNRDLHRQIKDLTLKLKQREAALLVISDQNKHFHQLNRDKHLEERDKLNDRVKELEMRLLEQGNEMKILARKNQLETKTLKCQIQQEHHKYRELNLKYEKVKMEVARTISESSFHRFHGRNLRDARSAVSVDHRLNPTHHHSFYQNCGEPEDTLKIRSCSNSVYSKSSVCDSHRNNDILYEEAEPDSYEKLNTIENMRKLRKSNAIKESENVSNETLRESPKDEDDKKDQEERDDKEEQDLVAQFQRINKDIEQKELQLDEVCEDLIQKNDVASTKLSDQQADIKRQNIDPKKKTKLLAALKAIDANESFDS